VVFNKEYADVYDALYRDKDYEKECDFIEAIFRKHDLSPESILDLGCGTGGHALILAKRGYRVTGVERAADMLAIARRKANQAGTKVMFLEGDITNVSIHGKFDVVLSMFAVMGYQVTDQAVAAVCKQAKNALVNGGFFLFDCWHGPAVILNKPDSRIKEAVGAHGEKILRITTPDIDPVRHLVNVNFRLLKGGQNNVHETSESHLLRFFFPQEIKYHLESAGFKKIELYPFLDLEKTLSETDWNMMVVAG